MNIIRVAQSGDLGEMVRMFLAADDRLRGLTSLSSDHAFNEGRLDEAEVAMNKSVEDAARFLFVLADSETGVISGTSGIGNPGHHTMPSHLVEDDHEFGNAGSVRSFRAPALSLVNDADGYGEFQSLFLCTTSRGGGMGTLLSRSRMLLIADHCDRFPVNFVSELRGRSDADGNFPFWEGLGRHYTGLSSSEAEATVACKGNTPIAAMLPKDPLPMSLLSEATRAAISEVHPATEGARRLLASEGFVETGLVNILDGGPMPTVEIAKARSVAFSRVASVEVVESVDNPQSVLLSNREWERFRSTLASVAVAGSALQVDKATASALQIESGDEVRYLNLEATK